MAAAKGSAKRASKRKATSIDLTGSARADAVAARLQRMLLKRLAKEFDVMRERIDAGLLPTEAEWRFVAAVLRGHAKRLDKPVPKTRGNPNFQRKVDPAAVALMVGMQVVTAGASPDSAAANVATSLGIDTSTAAKHFRDRREAVLAFLGGSNSTE